MQFQLHYTRSTLLNPLPKIQVADVIIAEAVHKNIATNYQRIKLTGRDTIQVVRSS